MVSQFHCGATDNSNSDHSLDPELRKSSAVRFVSLIASVFAFLAGSQADPLPIRAYVE
jgi:hypothetical protein